MTRRYLSPLLLAVLLAGCKSDTLPNMPPTVGPSVPPQQRVTVTRIGVFKDDIAYGELRGVYIITDSKTGKEYLGISGIGVSELGDHQAGKTRFKDER